MVGLDYPAIIALAGTLRMKMTPALLAKIRRLELWELARMDEDRKQGERNRAR